MRVLIATNGTLDCEHVLSFGAWISGRTGEPPTILSVVAPGADGLRPSLADLRARARQLFGGGANDVQAKVRVGRLAEEILREVCGGGYDLLVVGEGPAGHWSRHLLRTMAIAEVAELAPCPVAVVKGKVATPRRILLCDSGAQGPAAAFSGDASPPGSSVSQRFVTCLAGVLSGGEEITVLHVMSQISAGPGVRGKQLRADARDLIRAHTPEGELLRRDVHLLKRSGFRPRAAVRHGLVVDEILVEARGGDHDLVVIGAPLRSGWSRVLLDDLAHKIIDRLDRPVLVVH